MSKLGVSLWTIDGGGPSLGEVIGCDENESDRPVRGGMLIGAVREAKYWFPVELCW